MSHTLHPLAEELIFPIASWTEFLHVWENTPVAEFRHSLLHFGFKIDTTGPDKWCERILFYLKYADGYEDTEMDTSFEERGTRTHVPAFSSFGDHLSIVDVRKQVARKAFDMLCEHVFKDRREDKLRPHSWLYAMSDQEVFEAVLHFFRRTERGRLRNFPLGDRDHKREIVQRFLLDLANISWKANPDRHMSKEFIARLEAARPRLVEILCGMKRPDYLLEMTSGFYRVEPLDKASLRKLYEVAMNQEVPIPYEDGDRKPKTIEEAAASGSKAAMVYMILKSREKEFNRLSRIRELEDERRRVEQQLKKAKA